MADITFHKMSWEDFERDSLKLAKELRNITLTKLVAVSRGGLVLARILSDLLELPISTISIASYADYQQSKEPLILEGTTSIFAHDKLLLVDEVTDTGKTLVRALSYLKNFPHTSIHTCSLVTKTHAKPQPDFFASTIDKWIIYPYDLQETYASFVKMFGSSEKALLRMKEVGFVDWELSAVNK